MKPRPAFMAALAGLLFAILPVSSPCQQAVLGATDLATLEGKTLRPANSNDLAMLSIWGGNVMRTARLQGRPTQDGMALAQASMQAAREDRPTEAFRYAIRAIALVSGGEISEGLEVATAYDLVIDRKIVAPGQNLRVFLDPLFTLDRPLEQSYTVHLTLHAGDQLLATLGPYTINSIEVIEATLPVDTLEPGRNYLWYELRDESDQRLVAGYRDFFVAPEVPDRIASLREKLAVIKAKELEDARSLAAAETIEYFADVIGRATEEYVTITWKKLHPMMLYLRTMRGLEDELQRVAQRGEDREPFRIEQDLALAEALAAALLADEDPFHGQSGDLHLAHRSPIDNTLQPYRAFIPQDYDSSKAYPLIIGLHGASGNENSFMRRPDFIDEARKRGYLLATPNGRGPFTGYRGDAGADVLEVLDRMLATHSIDPEQVFLTGHSMGGGGTWRVGFRAPERFRALAPIAGAPPPNAVDLDAAPDMPVLYSAGVEDRTVPIENVRRLAKAAEQKLNKLSYVEYPEDGHAEVPDSAMLPIFEFFDDHRTAADAAND
jgi:predicted esterase